MRRAPKVPGAEFGMNISLIQLESTAVEVIDARRIELIQSSGIDVDQVIPERSQVTLLESGGRRSDVPNIARPKG